MIIEAPPRRSSLVTPVVLGAVAGAALVGLHQYREGRQHEQARALPPLPREGRQHEQGRAVPPLPREVERSALTPPPSRAWIYPVPRWRGRAPRVSDGYGSRRRGDSRGKIHRGADIMFRRRYLGELTEIFPPRAPHSLLHFMPAGTLAVAAFDGDVWSAGETSRGHSVVLSHGRPWATYYTHLVRLFVRETEDGRSRERVRAGQPLGVIGADPTDHQAIAHLHFEIWHNGDGRAAIDPEPFLNLFTVIDSPEVN